MKLLLLCLILGQSQSQYLQDISVTVLAPTGSGSGLLINKTINKEDINFVLTAAHVVQELRSVRETIDTKTGQKKQVIEFKDAKIMKVIKEPAENQRKVGEFLMDAKVFKYSDVQNGDDLAVLILRKRGFVKVSTKFYLDNEIPQIGTRLYHVGSLLGQAGNNSMTFGILSQIGRVLDGGNGIGKVFDQVNTTIFPGSSGGGVFFTEESKEHNSKCIGIVARSAGEGFSFIIPIRRVVDWSKRNNIEWLFNESIAVPKLLSDLEKSQVEESPSLDFNINKVQEHSF